MSLHMLLTCIDRNEICINVLLLEQYLEFRIQVYRFYDLPKGFIYLHLIVIHKRITSYKLLFWVTTPTANK